MEHAHNPTHRRYEYDPARESVRTLEKLRGEFKSDDEVNSQLRSGDTGLIRTSESFRCDPAAN